MKNKLYLLLLILSLNSLNAQQIQMPFLQNKGMTHDSNVLFASYFTHTRSLICSNKIIYQKLLIDSTHILKAHDNSPFDIDIYSHKATNISATFLGCNLQNKLTAIQPTGAYAHFFIGSDSTKWVTNLPYYNKLEQKSLYKGIDVEYYINDGEVEYNLNIQPYADIAQIKIQFDGIMSMEKIDEHTLRLITHNGDFIYQIPSSYQIKGGKKNPIDLFIKIINPNTIAFQSRSYNAGLPLVIDPALKFSTYIGGSNNDFYFGATKLVIDDQHNIYNAGITQSTDFPTTTGAYSTTYNGGTDDACVMKFKSDGTLLFSTFLGGSDIDYGYAVAIYPKTYDILVTGGSWSSGFPVTTGVYQTTNASAGTAGDIFVTKLNSKGSAIKFSTFVGGSLDDQGENIALDSIEEIVVVGQAQSIPTTTGVYQPSNGGDYDSYVVILDSNAHHLLAGTFVGGADRERTAALGIGKTGFFVGGSTTGSSFPTTTGAYSTSYSGGLDGIVYKISKDLKNLIYSTYIGSTGDDWVDGFLVDGADQVTFGGLASSGFPTVSGCYQTTFGGGTGDAYIAKFNAKGSALVFSSLCGGSGDDAGYNICKDSCGNLLLTGSADKGFPTTSGAYNTTFAGGASDAFIAKFDSNATHLLYSTYIGGSGDDIAKNIRYDSGYAVIVGQTTSSDYPTTTGAYQTKNGGGQDIFFTKLYLVNYSRIVIPDTSFCLGKTVEINASGAGSTILWSTGDTTKQITISKPGIYWLKAASGICNAGYIDSFKVTGNKSPIVSLGNDTAICVGEKLVLKASNQGATYIWNTGDTTASLKVTLKGVYKVTVSLKGCTSTDSINVIVNNKPAINLGAEQVLCQNTPVFLDAGNPGATYKWSNGANTEIIKVDSSGNYRVKVTLNGCSADTAITVLYLHHPKILNDNNGYACPYKPTYLSVDSFPNTTYLWNNGKRTPSVMVMDTGTYIVYINNVCGISIDTVHLILDPNCQCVFGVPNAFSPNNDGLNDFFRPVTDCEVTNYTMRLYNRWGEMLYETHLVHQGWDGNYKGQPEPLDVYVWYIEYNTKASGRHLLKGNVTLLR